MAVHLVVDVDLLAYRAATMHWNRETNETISPFYVVVASFQNIMKVHNEYLSQRFKIATVNLFVTSEDKSNFRYNIPCPDEYKGSRKGKPKPPDLLALKEYAVERLGAEMVHGQEADDAIGIEACKHPPQEVIVSSADKDLRMIPGIYWDHNTEHEPFIISDPGFVQITRHCPPILPDKKPSPSWVTKGGGLRWFYYQLLSGDTADSIKHPWRYAANELMGHALHLNTLPDEKAMFDYVLSVYLRHGSSVERLVTNGQLLWIRRKPDEIWQQP